MHEKGLDYDEAVLDVVSLIPSGKVLTYGDIAVILEKGGPRQVGAVMSRGGADVPWWRVLRADGKPPLGLEATAVGHYLDESTALRPVAERSREAGGSAGCRVDVQKSRWNPGPAEQAALQRIRADFHAAVPTWDESPPELSEPDDGV